MAKCITYVVQNRDMKNIVEFSNAVKMIDRVLADPRGWLQYGYNFIKCKNASSSKVLTIDFMSNQNLKDRYGKDLDRLSCYVPAEHAVHLNIGNWNGQSKSQMSIDRYRTYVVNHEVGHALGLGHTKCSGPGRRGSVMQQMSKGPEHIAPCTENEYPLEPSYWNEIKNNHGILFSGGGDGLYEQEILLGSLFMLILSLSYI